MKKNPVLVEVGLQIRAAREKAGISQEELAHKAGLDRTYLGGVERGERNLGLINLFRIAQALNVPASKLVAGITIRKGGEPV